MNTTIDKMKEKTNEKMKREIFYVGSEVWDDKLGPSAKLVFTYLCRCANRTGDCFPSVRVIGEGCGISKRTVQRALRELELAGAVAVEERYLRCAGGRRRTTNVYRLNCVPALSGRKNAPEGDNHASPSPAPVADRFRDPPEKLDLESEDELNGLIEWLGLYGYEDENVSNLTVMTVSRMWRRAYTVIEGHRVPREQVRERLRLLSAGMIDGALSSLKNPDIVNPLGYFETCLYNAPAEEAGRLSALQERIKANGPYAF